MDQGSITWVDTLARVSSPGFAVLVLDLVAATRAGDAESAHAALGEVVVSAPVDVQVPWLADRVLEALAAFGLPVLSGVPPRPTRALLGPAWVRLLSDCPVQEEVASRLLADGFSGDVTALVELSALLAAPVSPPSRP